MYARKGRVRQLPGQGSQEDGKLLPVYHSMHAYMSRVRTLYWRLLLRMLTCNLLSFKLYNLTMLTQLRMQVGLIRVLDDFVTEDSELWLFSDVPLNVRRNLLKAVSAGRSMQYADWKQYSSQHQFQGLYACVLGPRNKGAEPLLNQTINNYNIDK